MSPPVAAPVISAWIRANIAALDSEVIDKHLMKAFVEMCKTRNVTLTKQTVSKQSVYRAELTTVHIEKVEV
jgi:hypothetical protein